MRALLIVLLLLPAGSAVPVELLLHGGDGLIGHLHPDARRIDPAVFDAVNGPCFGLPDVWVFDGAWTVDPPYQHGDGTREYGSGDHGFGHSFNITDDARLVLPLAIEPAVGSFAVDVTLWRGSYHLPWRWTNLEEPRREIASSSWQGDLTKADGPASPTLEFSLGTAGQRIDIKDGVILHIEVRPMLPCATRTTEIQMRADEDSWPSLSFNIRDHTTVVGAHIAQQDNGSQQATIHVQHWRGDYGFPEEGVTVSVDGALVPFVRIPNPGHRAYHHGVAPPILLVPDLPLNDGRHDLSVRLVENATTVLDEQAVRWRNQDNRLVTQCGLEITGSTREERHRSFCEDYHHPLQTPAPGWMVPVAIFVLAVARRHS